MLCLVNKFKLASSVDCGKYDFIVANHQLKYGYTTIYHNEINDFRNLYFITSWYSNTWKPSAASIIPFL